MIAAVPIGDVLATRTALRNALLISSPVLLAALAAVAWRVIGWTLRPVEELRVGAEQISGRRAPARGAGDERLPVPPAADEIRALAITLNGMLDRLAAARERQRSFVADAAHELRSPLASMRAQLEVAERLGEGGSLPADLLGRPGPAVRAGRGPAAAGPGRRGRPAAGAADPVAGRALLAEVAAAYAGARVPVRWRRGRRRTCWPRRASCAGRWATWWPTPSGMPTRRSSWRWRWPATTVVLRVRDDGPGVAEADRERVFERFTRLDDARARDSGGTGLGLAIVRELVRRVGGEVALADAEPPWRLTAVVRLPRARST